MTSKYRERRQREFRWQKTNVAIVDDPDSPYVNEDTGYTYVTLVTDATGDNLPLYKEVIRQGGNATNQFFGSKNVVKNKAGSSSRVVTVYGADHEGNKRLISTSQSFTQGHDFGGTAALSPPISDGFAEDQARTKFVSKARRATTQFQSGVFLGEIRETIHAIKHPADAIRKGLDQYLGTVKKRARGFRPRSDYGRFRRMVGGTWLEYAFGWAPLLNDVQSAAEAFAQQIGGFTPPIKLRATGKQETVVGDSEGGIGTLFGDYSCRDILKQNVKATIYGAMAAKVASSAPSFKSSFGLRPRDFIPTIWELIPFSFVTDYFTNVGDIISAGCYSGDEIGWSGMSVKCMTERYSSDLHLIDGSVPIGSEFTVISGSASPGSVYSSAESLSRTVNPGIIPSLRFSVPGLRQGFNLAALFSSATMTSREFRRSLGR